MFMWSAGMTEIQKDAERFGENYPNNPLRSDPVYCSKRCVLPIYEHRQNSLAESQGGLFQG